ncbi:cardiolipin synthase [Bacillus cereus ATCC 10876]|uniref:cardiolipin synthase n=1 Tax=Bacillus TaxID=1386 RepID=UPI00019FF901|nr:MULTISPECIES: cardiolipin synthase [Bacillus]MDJ0281388.1 cardiolipin synthase [Bacillus bombysepticus]EEK51105.1 Cardiolipin synthetase domain protein [Bacillus cereus ATCC 10876]KFL74033.1 cardiolipin synthase [Bacillus cereus ATCC 10876]MBG9868412.1 cardiolipin synthetase [Bacillus cereus]MBO1131395.1 cardiolipin synthase [Bacillus cereus]
MKHFFAIILCLIGVFIWMNIDVEMGKEMASEYELGQVRLGEFQLYTNGEELYRKLFDDINDAEKYIYIHFYIVGKDEISQEFLQLLEKKASSGVEVKLSVDRVGGYKLKKKVISRLKENGVKFTFSKKPKLKNMFYSLHQRNHRRIVTIDGKVSYVGGFNIGKEYLGQNPKFGPWRDYHVRIHGEGAADMERKFAEDWKEDTGEKMPIHESIPTLGNIKYQYLFSNGKGLWEKYGALLKKAKKSLIIATPYFVPSKEMVKELKAALNRGVNVKILVPFKSDAILLKQAAYPYLKDMLHAGAEIYQYRNGFFHGKVTIIDGEIVDIGTANFDNRSFYLNYESNCIIYDKTVVDEVWSRLQVDFHKSKRFSEEDFEEISRWDWFLARIANVLASYL